MRDYGKIAPQFWTGETGKAIRAAGPQVQVVACYLMTGPSSTMWGLYYLPLPTLCHEVGCSLRDARKALLTLSKVDFAHYDECSEHAWIPNMAHFQIGESLKPKDKRILCIIKALEGLRNTPFFNDFLKRYQQAFCLEGVSPIDAPSMPLDSPSEARISIRSSRTGAGSVEQKQNITPPAVDREFDEWWNLYPDRNGKKVGKPEALRKWKRLTLDDRKLVLVATRNYADSSGVRDGIGIKDPHRWLCSGKGNEPWKEWLSPEQPVKSEEVKNGKLQLPRGGFEERDYQQGTF
jgi:hypothetical protein